MVKTTYLQILTSLWDGRRGGKKKNNNPAESNILGPTSDARYLLKPDDVTELTSFALISCSTRLKDKSENSPDSFSKHTQIYAFYLFCNLITIFLKC